jgi:hypothetical protein
VLLLSGEMILDKYLSSDHLFVILSAVVVLAGTFVFSLRKIGKKKPPSAGLGSSSTAKEVIETYGKGQYLQGKVAIVTGGNSGIGM